MKHPLLMTALCALGTVLLAACEPGIAQKDLEYSKATFTGHAQTTNEQLATRAKQAARDGDSAQALAHYERLYKTNGKNPETALDYAQILRETGAADRAVTVLGPFVKVENNQGETVIHAENPEILLEYASALLATGQYENAETVLQEIRKHGSDWPLAPQVHNLIGVSLDARGRHKEAESYYRQSIDLWQGQPVSVMNNLGLNLAHQGYFDRSLNYLRRALVMDPGQEKIAANIQMVTDIRNGVSRSNAAPVALN